MEGIIHLANGETTTPVLFVSMISTYETGQRVRLKNFGKARIELRESIFLIVSWNDYRVIWRHEEATIIAIFPRIDLKRF